MLSSLKSWSGYGTSGADDTKPKPSHHHPNRGYVNPWDSAVPPWNALVELPYEIVERLPVGGSKGSDIAVVNAIDWSASDRDTDRLQYIWLGHASFLLQFPRMTSKGGRPLRALFDPVFSDRASPSQYMGPLRRLKPPCSVEDLPELDMVFISHDHYDHLDLATIEQLMAKFGTSLRYFVPLGLKAWFTATGVTADQITELDWWEEKTIPLSNLSLVGHKEESVRVICTPAQHQSGRGVADHGMTLWCGWALEQLDRNGKRTAAVYHAGDTGYRAYPDGPTCPAFAEIGRRYGPFDLSFIPIWRGGTLSSISTLSLPLASISQSLHLKPHAFTSHHHATPLDAVCIHRDVRSKHSVGMHFATFGSVDEERRGRMILKEALEKEGIALDAFVTHDIGTVEKVAM